MRPALRSSRFWLPTSGADYLFLLKRIDFLGTQTENLAEYFPVVLPHQGRRARDRTGRLGETHPRREDLDLAGLRMVNFNKGTPGLEMLVLDALTDRENRTAGKTQRTHHFPYLPATLAAH